MLVPWSLNLSDLTPIVRRLASEPVHYSFFRDIYQSVREVGKKVFRSEALGCRLVIYLIHYIALRGLIQSLARLL